MPRRVVLPESRIRQRRRVRRARLAILLGVLLLLLLGATIGLSWLPQVRIAHITVSGAETISTSTIEEFAKEKIDGRTLLVFPKDNILLYPKKEIAQGLLHTFPTFKEVEVRAKHFDHIEVVLSERHAKALWCGRYKDETEGCRLIDETGFVYTPVLGLELPSYIRYTGEATTSEGYIGTVTPRQYLNPVLFTSLTALVEALEKHQKETNIISAYVDEHQDVELVFANGFRLMFALADARKDVYERFVLALASEPFLNKTIANFEYLDLRFGDKLYYKER